MNAIVANLLSLFLHLQVLREAYMTDSPTYSLPHSLHGTVLEKLKAPQQVRNSPHFMDPEVLLLHSPEPATCPCPKPDYSIPCLPQSYFLNIHFDVILPSMPSFHTKFLYGVLVCLIHARCPVRIILLDMITWIVLVGRIHHESPYYAVFCMPLRLIEYQKKYIWHQRTLLPIGWNAVQSVFIEHCTQ
jgi:hypothetical protein